MRGTRLILIFLLAPWLSRAQDADTSQVYFSLQDAIDYALVNNEQLNIAELEKRKAKAKVGEVRSQGLPQVDISGGLNYNFEPQKSLLNPEAFSFGPDTSSAPPSGEGMEDVEVSFQQKYDGNVSIGLRQLIFDGSYFVGLQAARTFRELSTKEHIKSRIDIIEAVMKAYYSVLISRERLELVERNYQRLDTLLYETAEMYENGFAEKIDVDRIQVNYNNAKVEKSRLSRLNEISEKLLKFQMGMSLDRHILLSDKLEDVRFEVPVQQMSVFEYNNRIEYSQLITNQNLARLDMKNNRAQYLPEIYASAVYGYNTATSETSMLFDTDRWLNFGALGLTVSIPVFDGLYKSYKIQQNKLEIEQLEFRKRMLQKNIDLEIEQARIDLDFHLENLDVQEQNMELADEVFRVTTIKFQEGVGSNLEVVEADASLKEAQTNYYNALYETIIAQIELEKALGILHK